MSENTGAILVNEDEVIENIEKNAIANLRSMNLEGEARIASLEAENAGLKQQRDDLEWRLGNLQDKHDALEDTAGDQGDEIERLRQELARLTESANKDRDILNTVVEAVSRREK